MWNRLPPVARNLHKAESRMEKLSRALDEVDAKVAGYRRRFETLTKEAAELKIKLDKENETIQAAEMLVTKLDGEYQRWSSQVTPTVTKNIIILQAKKNFGYMTLDIKLFSMKVL